MSKIGLVSTFRFAPSDTVGEATENETGAADRCWSVLSSFLLFHLAKGVDHIFLYADADDEWNRVHIGELHKTYSACSLVDTVYRDAPVDGHAVS